MKAMMVVAGLLAPLTAGGSSPADLPPRAPADAAQRDVDRRFWAGQADMKRLRAESWREMQRQHADMTPEGLRPRPDPQRPGLRQEP